MNPNAELKTSRFYFCIGRMLVIGQLPETELHHHGAVQLIISLEKSFAIKTDGVDWRETNAVLIDSGVPHQLRDLNGLQAALSIIPGRTRGKNLQKYVLNGSAIQFLDHLDLTIHRNNLLECFDKRYSCPSAFRITEEMIDDIAGVSSFSGPIDDRIQSTLSWIQQNLSRTITAKQLAQLAFLSEHRFLHLFKEQLGLPLRQYILYQRIMVATMEFMRGKSLTEAAHLAGFSDSAHFTRTFIQMNGLKPSQVSKYKDMFHFCFCSVYCDACRNLRKP